MPNWLKMVFNALTKVWVVLGAVVVYVGLWAVKSSLVVSWVSKERVRKFLGL